ncbi:DUF636 domain protein [Fusarium beomiforme]|uniref:DUF636 domain protein n=1 Tax=Fusarium beomiforme TaxID=44412 RepID=A0A9P5ALY4_9HYPO|nr:DUF636 domain protein [Fusarium beomiforme]
MALTGSCMCGAIAYKSDSDAAVTALCHCVDCQKWTGGAFTSNAVVAENDFSVTKGSPKHLYTRLDVMPGNIIIKAGGLDNGKANLNNKIDVEFYCRDRVSYLQAAEGAKQEHLFG